MREEEVEILSHLSWAIAIVVLIKWKVEEEGWKWEVEEES